MFIIERQWCGLKRKKCKLFGVGEDFIQYELLFFKLIFWKKGGKVLDILRQALYTSDGQRFLEYLPQMKQARKEIREDLREKEFGHMILRLERGKEQLEKRCDSLNRRCSDLTNENESFRNVIKIINGEQGNYHVSHGFPDTYESKEG